MKVPAPKSYIHVRQGETVAVYHFMEPALSPAGTLMQYAALTLIMHRPARPLLFRKGRRLS